MQTLLKKETKIISTFIAPKITTRKFAVEECGSRNWVFRPKGTLFEPLKLRTLKVGVGWRPIWLLKCSPEFRFCLSQLRLDFNLIDLGLEIRIQGHGLYFIYPLRNLSEKGTS